MKRLLLIALALICAVPAFAEGVWSSASEGYYHKDANCTFGMEYNLERVRAARRAQRRRLRVSDRLSQLRVGLAAALYRRFSRMEA